MTHLLFLLLLHGLHLSPQLFIYVSHPHAPGGLKEGGREGAREGGKEGGRKGGKEGGREGRREEERGKEAKYHTHVSPPKYPPLPQFVR